MTVEAAANGDVRSEVAGRPSAFFLVKNNDGYVIRQTPTGLAAERVSDIAYAVATVRAEKDPNFEIRRAQTHFRQITIVQGGPAIIDARVGTAYYWSQQQRSLGLAAVISHDPALAAIGFAWAREHDAAISMLWSVPDSEQQMTPLLKSGAPLEVYTHELTSISNAPISPSRFQLPANIETRAEVLQRIEAAYKTGLNTVFLP